MGKFLPGKLPYEFLKKLVFTRLGVSDERLLVGPSIGEDAAVMEFGDKVLVLATDPITAATKDIGWLSVHINANDVASCGVRPRWFLCTILLPEGSDESMVDQILSQIDRACKELGISVIGGHTEISAGLNRPIIIGFMMGEAPRKRYVRTGGARPGDLIILTKGAGLEGTAVLASELEKELVPSLGRELVERAKRMMYEISVVKDAMVLMDSCEVHALHDPTEGGIASGIWEMALASNVSMEIYANSIPIREETQKICSHLGLNPLNILSSGALLASIKGEEAEKALKALESEGISAAIIGCVKKGKGVWMIKDKERRALSPPPRDEVYEVLESLLSSK
ncbi:MAG TPA: hydrogenase [Candidatus Korarchaeota archaeon]|nr:hydrogenase [Candidatus Korarchaeota archaeon]